jgi:hypothetical protein
MKTTGLLWFDDDPRRTVIAKIAEAVERYRERIGFEPTVCEVNPAQMPSAAPEPQKRQRRSKTPTPPVATLPKGLQLVPSEQVHPNYFMLGSDGDEALIPIWRRDMDDDEAAPKPTAPRRPRPTQPRVARPQASELPARKAAAKESASHAAPVTQPRKKQPTQPVKRSA